jgi:hypothetical protein
MEAEVSDKALFRPHPAQIIAIFRILGFEKGY